ncbi:MAG TPA: hypothetical protein VGR26_02140 [Acidimicrobiales bacterium]|nr:hypothetical protein [Acidimicrobiales bacterium]
MFLSWQARSRPDPGGPLWEQVLTQVANSTADQERLFAALDVTAPQA